MSGHSFPLYTCLPPCYEDSSNDWHIHHPPFTWGDRALS
jgi:hypothetical protein